MGRGKRRKRLSVEDELFVEESINEYQIKEVNDFKVKGFVPRTDRQSELVETIKENEVTVAIGSAGSGKTFTALATAFSLLEEGYEKIILIKSVTTLPEEEIGYGKGSISEKMEPFMMSFTWNIDKLMGKDSSKKFMDKGILEVLPLAFARGISIDDSIVILDEAQNFSDHTFKTIMTRIGTNSKYIFLGDIEQVDRKKKEESCLSKVVDIFRDEDYIGIVEFTDEDCVRNPIIPKILEKLRENNM